jgi:choline kinase
MATPFAKKKEPITIIMEINHCDHSHNCVTTAVLLAAGTGSRLQPLTDNAPKCLTEVNGIPILERQVRCLCQSGFKRLVVVVGYMEHRIREFLNSWSDDLQIDYVVSPHYRTTNNIYSLWLARKMVDESFLLLESDLLFQAAMLKPLLQPNRIAVSKLLPWMNGTMVTLNDRQQLDAFLLDTVNRDEANHFKTVNLYSFSRNTWQLVWERLDRHISEGKVKGYYETVLAEIVAEGNLTFDPVFFDANRWYEIDTIEDLIVAEKMFSRPSPLQVNASKSLPPIRKPVNVSSLKSVKTKKHSVLGKPIRTS